MKTVQSRIGILFFTFSFILYLTKIAYCAIGFYGWTNLLSFDRILYFFYPLVFFITILREGLWAKIFQIVCVLFEALFSLKQDPTSPFFGLSMIVISLLLCYKYGLLKNYFIPKVIAIFCILYLLFIFIPLINRSDKLIYAGEWVLFLAFFLGTLWFIFRDSIKMLEEKESATKERYMKIIDEATSVAREAIDLCEKEKQKIDERC